jgi:hypothetical protein
MIAVALHRRYGRARSAPTVHQCPGCGDDVAVKRPAGFTDDEDRMCTTCQRAARRAGRKAAAARTAARIASRPVRRELHDALGFFIGYEDQYTPAEVAEIIRRGGRVG